MYWGQRGDVLGHPQGHFVGDHITAFGYGFIVVKNAHYDVNKVTFAGMWCMLTYGREKVTGHVDVIFDCAGLDGGGRDCFPLDKGDSIAGKEVVL